MGIYGLSEELENLQDGTVEEPTGDEYDEEGADNRRPSQSDEHASGDDQAAGDGEATDKTPQNGLMQNAQAAVPPQGQQVVAGQAGAMSPDTAQLHQLLQQMYLASAMSGQAYSPYSPYGAAMPATPAAPVPIWPGWGMMPQYWQPQQQQQAQQQQTQPAADDEDPDKWLQRFYEEGPKAIDARVEARARAVAEQLIQQAAQQYLAPLGQSLAQIQQFVNQEAMRRYYGSLLSQAAQGKDDFQSLRQDVEAVLREQPHLIYLPFQTGQNPYEVAYHEAKKRREKAEQEKQQQMAVKRGARMPGPAAATVNRRQPQPQDIEKAYIRAIFSSSPDGEGVGIYDQIN